MTPGGEAPRGPGVPDLEDDLESDFENDDESAAPELPPGLALHGRRGGRPGRVRRLATRAWWLVAGRRGTVRRLRWRRLRLPAVIVLVLAVLGAGTWVVGWTPVLDVRAVEVEGTSSLTVQQVLAAAEVPAGIPLARLDPSSIGDRVADLAPVRSVSVYRRFPHTVVIRVTERTAAALIVGDNGAVRVVDTDAAVYAPAGALPTNLPVLVDSGVALDVAAVTAGVTVLDALPVKIRNAVTAVVVGDDDSVVLDLAAGRSGRTVVRWGTAADTPRKARVLAALLKATPDPWLDVSAAQVPVSRSSVPRDVLPSIPAVGRAAAASGS